MCRGVLFAVGLVLISASPGLAQSNYTEQPYASVRGWNVISGWTSGRFDHCAAEKSNRGNAMRIGYNGKMWLVGMPSNRNSSFAGAVEVDGRGGPAIFNSSGTGWVVTTQFNLEAVRAGNKLFLDIGSEGGWDFSLKGSAAALLKVEECVANRGVKRRRNTANNQAAAPAKRRYPVESDAHRMKNGCPPLGSIVSIASSIPATIEFVYGIASGRSTQIYWIDLKGNPVSYANFDGSPVSIDTYSGHAWIVKDFDGTCYGDGVMFAQPGHNRFVVR